MSSENQPSLTPPPKPDDEAEHACTDIWSIGWYLCICGEPWLNQAQRCMTQPGGVGYPSGGERRG